MSHVVISLHSLPQFKMHEHMTQYDELCQLILLIKEIPCEDSGPEEAAVVQRVVHSREILTHIFVMQLKWLHLFVYLEFLPLPRSI